MITLGIVDQDALERKAIEHLLTKNYNGMFQKVFGANNGTDAISLAIEHKPDLIIFDLHIPNINGLDTATVIRKLSPECEFIVITANNEFEYVQRALHLGVSGYLLKPIIERELCEIIDKVFTKIIETHDSNMKDKANESRRQQLSVFLDKQIIHDMITGESIDNINSPIFSDHLQLTQRLYRCVVIRALAMAQPSQKLFDEVRKRLIGYGYNQVIGTIFSDSIVLLISASNTLENLTNKTTFESIIKITTEHAERLVRETYVYAFSSAESSLELLSRSYYQAKKIIGNKRNIGIDRTELLRLHELETTLLKRIQKLDKVKVYELLNRLMILVYDIENETLRKDVLKDFCFFVERNIWKNTEGDDFARETSSAIRKIYETSDQNTVRDSINEFISECMMSIERRNAFKLHDLIENVKEYITENISGDISLEVISRQFGISPSYLSRQFKKAERINMKEYIVKARMGIAKEYLAESEKNVAEIATLAGYSNANYFSNAFKKYEGVTPKTYAQTGRKSRQN